MTTFGAWTHIQLSVEIRGGDRLIYHQADEF
jgi:hypothetical protein